MYLVYKNGKKFFYVKVLHAIYGMLVASLLWYRKLWKNLEVIGFKFNIYDPCIANITKNDHQHKVCLQVNGILVSHKDKKVNSDSICWAQKNIVASTWWRHSA